MTDSNMVINGKGVVTVTPETTTIEVVDTGSERHAIVMAKMVASLYTLPVSDSKAVKVAGVELAKLLTIKQPNGTTSLCHSETSVTGLVDNLLIKTGNTGKLGKLAFQGIFNGTVTHNHYAFEMASSIQQVKATFTQVINHLNVSTPDKVAYSKFALNDLKRKGYEGNKAVAILKQRHIIAQQVVESFKACRKAFNGQVKHLKSRGLIE